MITGGLRNVARIKFTKLGSAKFIGHLDLLRYFQKAFKRAKVIPYSQGYNPRQITTFASFRSWFNK